MTYPSCSCSLLAHQVRRSAEPRGVCGELWIASITKWKRDTRFFTVMSNGVVVVPCSMKPRTWKRLVLGLPWISWCTAPGKPSNAKITFIGHGAPSSKGPWSLPQDGQSVSALRRHCHPRCAAWRFWTWVEHSGVSIYTHRWSHQLTASTRCSATKTRQLLGTLAIFAAAGRLDHQSTPSSRR